MRGEDFLVEIRLAVDRGSPPHARGRPSRVLCRGAKRRITPACAGKTGKDPRVGGVAGDHPRMRGEDCGCGCVEA